MCVFKPGFPCRFRSMRTAMNGSRASSKPMAFAMPSMTMSLSGSRTWPERNVADRFANQNWPKISASMPSWSLRNCRIFFRTASTTGLTDQSEWSTDILFKSRQQLSELYPRLLSHSILCFAAKQVMNSLGRKLRGKFEGEIVSDLSDLSGRIPGSRIKHRVKENWLKMYDKGRSRSSGRNRDQ